MSGSGSQTGENKQKMVCTTCDAILESGSHFCSNCGTSLLDGAAGPAGEVDRRVNAALAEANLLRMRAQWQDAEARCIDVLRLNPNNVHAHSLLGDIYRDQGRHNEASQWYQMALDLNPGSVADRAKLAHVEHARGSQLQTPNSIGGDDPAIGTQRLAGLPPATWLRALTAISVLFVVTVAALLISMKDRTSGSRGSAQNSDTITVQGPPPSSFQSKSPLGTLSPMPKPNSSPTVESGDVGAKEGSASPTKSREDSRRPGSLSNKELALQSYIAKHISLAPNTSVASVSFDQNGQAVIWLTHLLRESGDAAKAEIVQAAIQGARAAFNGDTSIQAASMRVFVASESGSIEPVFDGDVSRADLQSLAATSTADQAVGVFTNVRWSPSMTPTAGPQDLRRGDQDQ